MLAGVGAVYGKDSDQYEKAGGAPNRRSNARRGRRPQHRRSFPTSEARCFAGSPRRGVLSAGINPVLSNVRKTLGH